MLLIMAESNIECGFMEDFVEEVVQQQDSQGEQDAVQATEETMEAVPCEETAAQAEEATGDVVSEEAIAALEEKRDIVNEDAEKHRKLRDELNNQTKEWKAKRDALNAQVRELVDEAGKCREERDSLNQKVRETKGQGDEGAQGRVEPEGHRPQGAARPLQEREIRREERGSRQAAEETAPGS